MSYIVTSSARISLNEQDPVASILQNVSVIMATAKGTVPLDRELGIATNFLDKPLPVARVLAISEIREAIERYEPRVRVLNISFEQSESGTLIPTVEVEINE